MQHLARVIRHHQEKRKEEKLYTTAEAARRVGVSRQTVQAWIATGKTKGPELILPVHIRLWSKEDIAQLKKVERRPGRRRRENAG
jgi:DNA-binding XRE family transcriptional regulator